MTRRTYSNDKIVKKQSLKLRKQTIPSRDYKKQKAAQEEEKTLLKTMIASSVEDTKQVPENLARYKYAMFGIELMIISMERAFTI